MNELSVFADESGNCGRDAKYYLLVLVFHNQSKGINSVIRQYEADLADRRLRNIPLHMNPLMRGNESYYGMTPQERISLLRCFGGFVRKCPIEYALFSYQKSMFSNDDAMFARMRRDVTDFLFDNLTALQQYDIVKIYYDDGQDEVTGVIHDTFEHALGTQAIVYRDCSPSDFRLQQIADYICELELAAIKYSKNEQANTEKIIFGAWRDFNKQHLKRIRKKRLN